MGTCHIWGHIFEENFVQGSPTFLENSRMGYEFFEKLRIGSIFMSYSRVTQRVNPQD